MKYTIIGCVAAICLYKLATIEHMQSSLACDTFAHITAEKMWACGMLRTYNGVATIRANLAENLVKRQASEHECTATITMVEQQSCREFEMMVNTLAIR